MGRSGMSHRKMAKNKVINMLQNKNKIQSNKNHVTYIKNIDIFSAVEQRISAKNAGCTVFVPHVCNNVDLFGAGFAGDISLRYPEVEANYHLLGKSFLTKNMGYSQILKIKETEPYKHKFYVVNMIAQNGTKSIQNHRPLNYYGLIKSMVSLAKFIDTNTGFLNKTENIEIHCPRFGSGLAGGNWNFISDLIEDVWGKYPVFVYLPYTR